MTFYTLHNHLGSLQFFLKFARNIVAFQQCKLLILIYLILILLYLNSIIPFGLHSFPGKRKLIKNDQVFSNFSKYCKNV